MDITSFIAIVIAIVIAYFFIKLIVSPLIKAIAGVIIFFIAIYLLQRFTEFNLDRILTPFGISLNLNEWGFNFNSISGYANYYIEQAKNFISSLWENIPKNLKQ